VIGQSTQAILENQGVILGAGEALVGQASELIEAGTGVDPVEVIDVGSQTVGEGVQVIEDGVGKLFDLFGRGIESED